MVWDIGKDNVHDLRPGRQAATASPERPAHIGHLHAHDFRALSPGQRAGPFF
jgi:hypothetical protein